MNNNRIGEDASVSRVIMGVSGTLCTMIFIGLAAYAVLGRSPWIAALAIVATYIADAWLALAMRRRTPTA